MRGKGMKDRMERDPAGIGNKENMEKEAPPRKRLKYYKKEDKLFRDFEEERNEHEEMSELYFDYCGIEECRPGHSFGPHVREEFLLHFVLKGKGRYWNGESWFSIGPDSAFLIYPGAETLYMADQEDPWYYCWVGFHGGSAGRVMERAGFTREEPVIGFDEGAQVLETLHSIMQMDEDSLTESFFRRAGINLVIGFLLMGSTNREGMASAEAEESSYTAYAARYLQRHFAEKILVADVASKIGISRSYLVRLFRQHYGISPQEYLIRLRMKHASECLVFTDDSIGNVASECGYADPLAFSRSFKQRFGKSPSLYRDENRAGLPQAGRL